MVNITPVVRHRFYVMINLLILLVKFFYPVLEVELGISYSDRSGAVPHRPPRKAVQKHHRCGMIRRARAQGSSNCTDTLYVKLYTTVATPACIILIVHVRQGHLLKC